MSTVGYANVVVVPTFDGFQKAVGRQVNSTMPAAGATAGSLMAGGMASGLTRGSGGIVSSARAAAATAGGSFITRSAAAIRGGASAITSSVRTSLAGTAAAGATAGATMGSSFLGSMTRALGPLAAIFGVGSVVSSGFGRLSSIENARATLTGLGHDTETVELAMESALNAVTGTAFGMDEAASMAAGLMASGIEPGEQLESTLRLVADAATIAGTSMEDMGSIFNVIGATDRMQAEELNRLGDRGIPILQMLSDTMGVTVDDVRELASAGEIGFAEFTAAMEDGLGGAALSSGDTTTGTWRNVKAAVSRLGAEILEPVWDSFKDIGNDIIDFIDEDLIPAWDRLVAWVDENKGWLIPLVQAIGAGIAAFTGLRLAIWGVNFAMALLGKSPALLIIAAIAGGLYWLWNNNETFRNAMISAWEAISSAVVHAWENWIQPALAWLWDFINEKLIPAVMWLWHNVMVPAWNAISTAVSWAWKNVLKPAFEWIWGFINDSLIPAVMWLWENVMVPAWDAISWAVDQAWSAINIIFDAIVWAMEEHIGPAVMWLWETVFEPAFEGIGNAISWAWDNVIKPIWETMATFVEDVIAPGIRAGIDIVESIFNGIANIFRLPINFVLDYVWNKGIVRVFNGVANAIGSDHRLDEARLIEPFGGSSSNNSRRERAGRGNAPLARAKGGYTPPGWTWVGEEGPELVNFADPSMIYTAAQSEALSRILRGEDLNGAQSRAAAGARPSQAILPMGPTPEDEIWAGAMGAMGNAGRAVDSAVTWARGALAATASAILEPIFAGIDGSLGKWGTTGGLFADGARSMKDRLIDWIRGQDEEYLARTMVTGLDKFDPAAMGAGIAGAGAGGGWMRPGPGPVTSRFGPRWGGHHAGIDLAMPIGTPLKAPFDGQVIRSGNNTLAGRTGIGLMMMLANGYGAYFGHLSRVFAANGQSFKRGQILALSGNTGNSTGPHLHFEVNRGNFQAPINPTVTGLFDQGGALEHGRMALNLSGKPEAVLTNDQWRMLEQLANTGGIPASVALRVGEREFTGYVEEIAYGEDRAFARVGGAWG